MSRPRHTDTQNGPLSSNFNQSLYTIWTADEKYFSAAELSKHGTEAERLRLETE